MVNAILIPPMEPEEEVTTTYKTTKVTITVLYITLYIQTAPQPIVCAETVATVP